MAGCYECNHCGHCTVSEVPVERLVLACMHCGKKVQPGEAAEVCSACGKSKFDYVAVTETKRSKE